MDQDVEIRPRKSEASPTLRGKDARWFTVPTPSHTRPQAVPFAWRVEPRRATRQQKRKFPEWKLDCRRYRGAQMAAISSAVVCQQRDKRMTNKPNNSPAPVAGQRRLPPVRVKVWRADGKLAKVHPPDGEGENWWRRLNKALGTTSSDFVNASLVPNTGCVSFALGRNFRTLHECCARDDRSRGAEGRN